MRHFLWNDHGELYKPSEAPVPLMPYGLIDHLTLPFLRNSIGVAPTLRQQTADDAL